MEPLLYHDSHDLYFRSPFGAVTCGKTITLRLIICLTNKVDQCHLRLWVKDREIILPMEEVKGQELKELDDCPRDNIFCTESQKVYEVKYQVPRDPGLIWYYFQVQIGSRLYYYGNNSQKLGGKGEVYQYAPPSYQITVYEPMKIPSWYRNGVIYQIFVDRFYNGDQEQTISDYMKKHRENALIHLNWYDNPIYIKDEEGRVIRWDFFGGNLLGIRKKLPYLNELGVTILYLNPIFESPSNHKYDTSDYLKIDPMFGDEEEFQNLIEEAARYGIYIILDGVFSHTGADSIYFNKYNNYPELGAYQSKDSPYYNWFNFEKYPDKYKCWWGVDDLPEVNEMDPSFREFIYGGENSVLKKWMTKGIKGWRLDVADELPDEFIQELRQAMKRIDSEAILLGEVWEDASNKISYGKLRQYFWGKELDSTMNYPFRDVFIKFLLGQIDALLLHQRVMSLYENYPKENFYAAMNLIGSHDVPRILTILGEAPPENSLKEGEREAYLLNMEQKELALKRLKLLTLIQMTYPGVPSIYYGDEAGLEGYSDPYNRKTYPWGRENQELLEWHKGLIALRKEQDLLRYGEFESFIINQDVYGFRRIGQGEEIIILINRHLTKKAQVGLDTTLDLGVRVIDLLEGELLHREVKEFEVELPPLTGKALLIQGRKWRNVTKGLKRSSGILLHISSLPSTYGVGDFGSEAYKFIDFLRDSHQSLWQVLPLNPTGVGDSPYLSESAFAGNIIFISLEQLMAENLLTIEEINAEWKGIQVNQLRYSDIKQFKENLLRLAFHKFNDLVLLGGSTNNSTNNSTYMSEKNYYNFLKENKEWLEDYALFRSLKTYYSDEDAPWYKWEKSIALREGVTLKKLREHGPIAQEINFVKFTQYTFFHQWQQLKNYANNQGISIIGDMPIFVAGDSCDVWANQELFKLREDGQAQKVAGVPPDYFSPQGQLWGNPVYDWQKIKETDYTWWKDRISQALKLYDYIRLDHFRGFEAYWEVDGDQKDATMGRWVKGPGRDFFLSLFEEFDQLPFVAEDLGIITPGVNVLKYSFDFPGMKVFQFSSREEIESIKDNNFICYTGTHDNDTLMGWFQNQGKYLTLDEYLQVLETIYQNKALWVITPMQDILALDSQARMNTPGTIEGNWKWRLSKEDLNSKVSMTLRNLTSLSNRGNSWRKDI